MLVNNEQLRIEIKKFAELHYSTAIYSQLYFETLEEIWKYDPTYIVTQCMSFGPRIAVPVLLYNPLSLLFSSATWEAILSNFNMDEFLTCIQFMNCFLHINGLWILEKPDLIEKNSKMEITNYLKSQPSSIFQIQEYPDYFTSFSYEKLIEVQVKYKELEFPKALVDSRGLLQFLDSVQLN